MKRIWVVGVICFLITGGWIQEKTGLGLVSAKEIPKSQEEAGNMLGRERLSFEDEGDVDLSLLDDMDFSQLDQVLKDQEIAGEFSFKELVRKLVDGEEIDKKQIVKAVWDIFFKEIGQSRGYMIQIILLVSAFALLYQFANVFDHAAVTDISFYIVYMILLALLMKSFLLMSGILQESLDVMLDFMKALMPAFCMTMVFSTGTASAMGFYEMTLLLVYVIEAILVYVAVPAVHVYLILELLNHLTKEEMISKMTELIKGGVEWLLKFLVTLVIGINMVQGLLTPVIDSFKTGMFARTASMLPGFGNSINAVAEIMVGSGIIIKNGVGIAGILFLIALCGGPLLKVGAMALIYKLASAVVQPIADVRLSGCINGMGEGARLMGKILLTANVMLLLTIALVTAATTWGR